MSYDLMPVEAFRKIVHALQKKNHDDIAELFAEMTSVDMLMMAYRAAFDAAEKKAADLPKKLLSPSDFRRQFDACLGSDPKFRNPVPLMMAYNELFDTYLNVRQELAELKYKAQTDAANQAYNSAAQTTQTEGVAKAFVMQNTYFNGERGRQCRGMNCASTDGTNHSMECRAEHWASVAGGEFVPHKEHMRLTSAALTLEHLGYVHKMHSIMWEPPLKKKPEREIVQGKYQRDLDAARDEARTLLVEVWIARENRNLKKFRAAMLKVKDLLPRLFPGKDIDLGDDDDNALI